MSRIFMTILVVILVLIIAGAIIVRLGNTGGLALGTNATSTATSTGLSFGTSTSTASGTSTTGTAMTPGVPRTGGTTVSPSPTFSPTRTASPSPTVTRTPTPTVIPTIPTATPTQTVTPSPTATGTSSQSGVPRGFIYIYSDSERNQDVVVENEAKNIPLIRFVVQAPAESAATIDELVLGSDESNTLFNYFENFRLFTSSGFPVAVLDYTYKLYNWRPIFGLVNSANIPAGRSVEYMIIADLKPNVPAVDVSSMNIYGGTGNMVISSNAEGSRIFVR